MKDLLNNRFITMKSITMNTIAQAIKPIPKDLGEVISEHLMSLREVIAVNHPISRTTTIVDSKGSIEIPTADNPSKELKAFNEIIRFTRAY